jgi:hypothetical protein
MSALSGQLDLASISANWTTIILIGIFALGLVLVVIVPMTIDVINAHRSWRKVVSVNPNALATMPSPTGIEGLARATIAIGLLVAIGFGLSYVLVEHPFSDNKTIITAILSALTTAFASVTAFYFGTRAMQAAQQAQQTRQGNRSEGTSSDTEEGGALTVAITSPQDGAIYTVNEAVNANYSVAPSTGAAITLLNGTVANGAPLDTTTLGDNVFTVNAKDSAGKEAAVTHTYTVKAAG